MRLLLIIALATTGLAYAGDHVGNGGGLAEKNIILTYQKLDQFIRICLASQSCKLSDKERELLNKIMTSLPSERAQKDQIRFESERANPNFFVRDGEVRIAVTGDSVGSPIYFNTDFLYTRGMSGTYEAISLADATTNLIHELGHHHGPNYGDHTELDALGTKVSLIMQQQVYTAPFLPLTEAVGAVVINERAPGKHAQIVVWAFGEMIDVSNDFYTSLTCTQVLPPEDLPDPTPRLSTKTAGGRSLFVVSKPITTFFHNVYWSDYKLGKKKGHFELKGNITNICRGDKEADFNNNDYKATVRFEVEKIKDKNGKEVWQLEKDSVEVKQHLEKWWMIIKLPRIF